MTFIACTSYLYYLPAEKVYAAPNKTNKHESMKLHTYLSRLQKLNAYLREFPSDTPG